MPFTIAAADRGRFSCVSLTGEMLHCEARRNYLNLFSVLRGLPRDKILIDVRSLHERVSVFQEMSNAHELINDLKARVHKVAVLEAKEYIIFALAQEMHLDAASRSIRIFFDEEGAEKWLQE
jgi:hypothetical protein